MKKVIIICLVIVAIALLVIFKPRDNKPQGSAMGGKKPAVPVRVVVAKISPVNEVLSVASTILANQETEIKPEVSGKIVSLNIKEGAHVKKGQLLLSLDASDLTASLEKNNAAVQLSADREKRLKQLLAKGGVSQQEYESAMAETVGLKAEQKRLQSLRNKTSMYAPFDGTVGLFNVTEGSYVTAGQSITRIANVHPLKLEFSVPERYVSAVKSGNDISFVVTDDDQSYKAKVYAIDPVIDPATRTLKAKATFENEDELIRPGTFAEVKVNIAGRPDAISLPTPAIVPVLKGQKVYRLKNNKAEEVKVETGLRTDSIIEILSGVTAGDSIVVSGVLQLKQGAEVKVIK